MIFLYHPITQIHTIHHPYLVIHPPLVIHHIPVPEIAFLIEIIQQELEQTQPKRQTQDKALVQTQEIEIPVLRRELELELERLLLEQLFQEIYFKIS